MKIKKKKDNRKKIKEIKKKEKKNKIKEIRIQIEKYLMVN